MPRTRDRGKLLREIDTSIASLILCEILDEMLDYDSDSSDSAHSESDGSDDTDTEHDELDFLMELREMVSRLV